MALSVSEIKHIARLARLELDTDEEQLFADQLSRVLDYIDQIQRVEERLASAEEQTPAPPHPDRAAAEQPTRDPLALDDFLRNAPESLDRFLMVPRVK